MDFNWANLILSSILANIHLTPPPLQTPGVTLEVGFEAYVGCEKDGKMYAEKQNHVVRENGVLKIVRICRPDEKGAKPA